MVSRENSQRLKVRAQQQKTRQVRDAAANQAGVRKLGLFDSLVRHLCGDSQMTAVFSLKRPGLVWAILIFYIFSAAWVLLSFYRIHSGAIALNPQQRAYFDGLGLIDYSLGVFLEIANLAGAISLFLLRRGALYLFGSALVVNMLSTMWQALGTNLTQVMRPSDLSGAIIGWVIMIAVCLYTWRLAHNEVLV